MKLQGLVAPLAAAGLLVAALLPGGPTQDRPTTNKTT